MKTLLTLGIAGALVAATAAQSPFAGRQWRAVGGALDVLLDGTRAPVTGAPFSAVEEFQWQATFAPGNLMMQQRRATLYRDSLGRVRIERWNDLSVSGTTMITIRDPVAGYFYQLNPTTLQGIRTPVDITSLAASPRESPGPPPETNDANSPKLQTTDLGRQMVSGVSATGTRTVVTGAAGVAGRDQPLQIVREEWVSPDLHLTVLMTISGPDGVQSTTRLTNLVRGEPDPALFQVPAGYLIRIWPGVQWPAHTS
jgi:hypothetical protein